MFLKDSIWENSYSPENLWLHGQVFCEGIIDI